MGPLLRCVPAFCGFVASVAVWLAPWHSCPLRAAERPNIVLIFSDDAGYADFGFSSAHLGKTTEFKTPNLDRLASQSVFATQAYVTCSICAVSRAGMLTGRYQQRFGFHYNALADDLPYEGIPEGETLLFEQLKSQGYSTAAIGKWHIGEQPQWTPQSQGVDYFFGMLGGGHNYFYTPTANAIRRNEDLVNWAAEPSFNKIAPDPTRGRELTDAFGDEASQYIAAHAGDAEPFFLYLAPNSPHNPFEAKAADLAQFNNTSLSGTRKTIAAMTYALDRAVGNVLARLDDPNGDGDLSDSIADNTIVIFTNDNGGASIDYSNGPLAGLKGSAGEGGVRVPTLIRAPGLASGTYDQQISTLDFFATFVAAAGGVPASNLDGVDLLPYLNGTAGGVPHEYLFQHNLENFSSVQDGQWKLVKSQAFAQWKLHRLNADGSGEDVDLAAQYPEKVAELVRAFVDFEVQTEKGVNTRPTKYHPGNTFVFRDEQPYAVIGWSNAGGWINEAGQPTGIGRNDSTSRFVGVFKPNNSKNYTAYGNTTRAASHAPQVVAAGRPDLPGLNEFMMNELRLAGSFTSTVDRTATIQSNPLLLVDSPEGRVAQIGLHATDDSPTGAMTYFVKSDLELYNDVHIVGDGDVNFEINGQIRDFYAPRSIIKEGSSRVTLTGDNTFGGDLQILAGSVTVAGAEARVRKARGLSVAAGAEYRQTDGEAAYDSVTIEPGGQFQLLGGKFEAAAIFGDFVNAGARFAMGRTTGVTTVAGDFTQTGGSLDMEIGGAELGGDYDHLSVAGTLSVAGSLRVSLLDGFQPLVGDAFWLFDATAIDGSFAALELPDLATGLTWNTSQLLSRGVVRVQPAGGTLLLSANFDGEGEVDAADLEIWQTWYGKRTSRGDADGDFLVTGRDFLAWQAPTGASASAVPEPGAVSEVIGLTAAGGGMRMLGRRRPKASRHSTAAALLDDDLARA